MTDERIVVTGCSGFVGRNAVKMLLEQGHHVVGFSRNNPHIDGLEFIEFDVTNTQNFSTNEYREATIINTAALTTNSKVGDFAAVNYTSVIKLLGLNPEGKFIHISSSSIYNLAKASVCVTEAEFKIRNCPFYNQYGEYKAKAEDALLNEVVERTIPPISLRPHAIYGEDDTTLIPKLKEKVKAGQLFLPEGGKVKHSLTNIKNLLQAIQLGLAYDPLKPEAFNVTDANPVFIADAVSATLGETVRIKGIPTKLLLSTVGKILGISEYEVRQLGMERTYDITKAKTVLGYNPSDFTIDW